MCEVAFVEMFRNGESLTFNIEHGSRHLGGFIGEKSVETEWISSKVSDWAEAVSSVATMATFVPHSAFVGFKR